MILYVTADKIGIETGGGVVTKNELEALSSLGDVTVLNPPASENPFDTEKAIPEIDLTKVKLAHFYSGTFPNFVKKLKEAGVKISYTVAAHDQVESKKEFELLGAQYNFPHMVQKDLYEKYISSYQNADLVISPSLHSDEINKKTGCTNTVVIPHGSKMLNCRKIPKTFNVGYLGQYGPDKGVKYLLEAWAHLNYKDANINFGGSQSVMLLNWIRTFKKGSYNIMGYVKRLEDFYNYVSVYVQPSVTEGFGIEVLEAMSAGRPVIVSEGAGAADIVKNCGIIVPRRNPKAIAEAINNYKNNPNLVHEHGENGKKEASKYTWDKIKLLYVDAWKNLLKERS